MRHRQRAAQVQNVATNIMADLTDEKWREMEAEMDRYVHISAKNNIKIGSILMVHC